MLFDILDEWFLVDCLLDFFSFFLYSVLDEFIDFFNLDCFLSEDVEMFSVVNMFLLDINFFFKMLLEIEV